MDIAYKVLSLKDKVEWNKYLEELPPDQQNIFWKPEYYQLFENLGEGIAKCFVYQEEDKLAMYPFLVNSINDLGYELSSSCFDIQGAYGYNGIITNSGDIGFLDRLAGFFRDFCAKESIIAEFIRFNPLLENHKLSRYVDPILHLDNAYIDLTLGIDDILANSYSRKVRQSIRKGGENNLKFEYYLGSQIDKNRLKDFLDVYYSTMDRNDAAKYYYFNNTFFENIIRLLGANSIFAFALHEGKVVSVELDFFNKETVIGFLGGTLKEAYQYKTNSFLRHQLVIAFKEQNFKKYNLGGGISKDDSLFKYKKSFSLNVKSVFFIGKKVHNQDIYEKITSQWKTKFPDSYEKNKNKLLGYREI